MFTAKIKQKPGRNTNVHSLLATFARDIFFCYVNDFDILNTLFNISTTLEVLKHPA